MIRRFLAFILGDMVTAEDLADYPPFESPPLVLRARNNPELADYAVAIAAKARDRTDAVLTGIQARASSFLTLVIGLVPLALAAVALGVPPADATPIRWLGFLLVVGAALALLCAGIAAALGAGMGLTASLNLAFMESDGSPKTLDELKAAEAGTWNYAAVLNMETARRRAADLFRARRLTVLALILALFGLTIVLASVGGQPAALLQDPSSTQPSGSPLAASAPPS